MNKVQLFLTASYYQMVGVLTVIGLLVLLLIVPFSVQVAWFAFQTVLIVALIAKIAHNRFATTGPK